MRFLDDLIGSDATIIVDFPGEGDDDDNDYRRSPSSPHRRERRRPIKWAVSLNDGRQAILFLDDGRHCLIVGISRFNFQEFLGENDIAEALLALGITNYPEIIDQLPKSISNRLQKAAS